MFRAIPCSSSGGLIVLLRIWYRHSALVESGLQFTLNQCTIRPLVRQCDDTRCRNNTIRPPEDEHGIARNMSRIIM
jgi:hypothetical protein